MSSSDEHRGLGNTTTIHANGIGTMNSNVDAAETGGGENLVQVFKNDELWSKFLEEEFDVARFTSSVIASGTVSSSLEKINSGMQRLDKELYSQVVGHHEDLIKQVSNIKDLESILKVISKGVDGIQGSINKIKLDITEPYLLVKTRTIQLDRMQNASELLRRILRFLFVSSKLRRHMGSASRELPKAAQCLFELETIRKESDLSGIEIIDNETRWIVKASEEVMTTASRMLTQGLDSLNQTEMATALQVGLHLNFLLSSSHNAHRLSGVLLYETIGGESCNDRVCCY